MNSHFDCHYKCQHGTALQRLRTSDLTDPSKSAYHTRFEDPLPDLSLCGEIHTGNETMSLRKEKLLSIGSRLFFIRKQAPTTLSAMASLSASNAPQTPPDLGTLLRRKLGTKPQLSKQMFSAHDRYSGPGSSKDSLGQTKFNGHSLSVFIHYIIVQFATTAII